MVLQDITSRDTHLSSLLRPRAGQRYYASSHGGVPVSQCLHSYTLIDGTVVEAGVYAGVIGCVAASPIVGKSRPSQDV